MRSPSPLIGGTIASRPSSRPPLGSGGDTLHERGPAEADLTPLRRFETARAARRSLTRVTSARYVRREEHSMPRLHKRVAVVGATGIAGQQFLVALDRHPWFEIVKLAASERSAGKTYAAAIRDAKTGARRWWG